MDEDTVIRSVVKHLENSGWKIQEMHLGHSHGIDINAWNPKMRRNYYIEAKGDVGRGRSWRAKMENYFTSALGQIVLRMESEWAPLYGVALPETYLPMLRKVHKNARKRLNLHFLIVRKDGSVTEE